MWLLSPNHAALWLRTEQLHPYLRPEENLLLLVTSGLPSEGWSVGEVWVGGPKGTLRSVRKANGPKLTVEIIADSVDSRDTFLLLGKVATAPWLMWLRELRNGDVFVQDVVRLRSCIEEQLARTPCIKEFRALSEREYDERVSGLTTAKRFSR